MFWDFLRRFIKGWFFPKKGAYSLRGFWGEIKHFNKDGVQIGYSVKTFWGARKRYDMNGNLISYTIRNIWGGYSTYDANGNLLRKSYRNIWGGYNTYQRTGKKIMESYRSFWGGMNHFDIESFDPAETYLVEKHRSTNLQRRSAPGKSVMHNSSKTDSVSDGERTYGKEKCTHQATETSASVQSKKADYNSMFSRQIDKTIPFYTSVSEFCENQDVDKDGVKILAFSYGKLKEFPAYANRFGDEVSVSPLVKNIPSFTFDRNEIEQAQKKVIEGLDMTVLENEFASFCSSELMAEFDELFPEYEYRNDGIARVQYELKCGLVVTENSWMKLKEAFK